MIRLHELLFGMSTLLTVGDDDRKSSRLSDKHPVGTRMAVLFFYIIINCNYCNVNIVKESSF